MERKKALALAGMLMILLASFALFGPIPPASAQIMENRRYCVMPINRKTPGNVVVRDSLNEAPIEQGIWNFTVPPLFSYLNITFSENWTLPGYGRIVNLTVPATSYVGISYVFFDDTINFWFNISTSLSQNGYGWIFLNGTGDVDCHTFSNNTGAYWRSPSPLNGTFIGSAGTVPSTGPDGVAGTGDDGFGNGTADPPGSSILILPTTMTAQYHTGTGWAPLFTFPWPQIFTTGNASSLVIEPDGGPGAKNASKIDGSYQTVVGQPWEFYAGEEYPALKVNYDDPKWNAYVTYVCAWSMLDIATAMGDYDGCFAITEKMVRTDLLIADIDCSEVCNIVDIVIAALAFDATDMNFGDDGIPYSPPPSPGDDKIKPDPTFDARGDTMDTRGVVNIVDIVRIALDFDKSLTP